MLKQLKFDSLNDYSDIEQVLATTSSSNTMSHNNHHNSNNQYINDSNDQNNEWRMQPLLMD